MVLTFPISKTFQTKRSCLVPPLPILSSPRGSTLATATRTEFLRPLVADFGVAGSVSQTQETRGKRCGLGSDTQTLPEQKLLSSVPRLYFASPDSALPRLSSPCVLPNNSFIIHNPHPRLFSRSGKGGGLRWSPCPCPLPSQTTQQLKKPQPPVGWKW